MVISLFDALTTAPMLSAYLITKSKEEYTGLQKILHAPARWFNVLFSKVQDFYEVTMRFTLKHKLLIIGSALAVFFMAMGLAKTIPKTFMPTNEWGEFLVILQGKPGVSLEQMTKDSMEVDSLIRKEKDIEITSLTVGDENGESDKANIFIKMVPSNKRTRSTGDMKVFVRNLLKPYKEILDPRVNDIAMAGEEYPVQLMLKGDNLEQLAASADNVMEQFKSIPGFVDIHSSYMEGKPEFQAKMIPSKMEKLGVQSTVAGAELRGMVEGNTPAKYRENGLEYDIRVQLKDSQQDIRKDFNDIYVPNVNNQLVKLKNIAEPISTTGPSKI